MTFVPRKQLRHVFHVTSGATPESGNAEYWDGDILWATPEDISSLDDYWLRDTRRKITRAGYESCGTTMAMPGSIVLTKRAPIGQLAVLEQDACSNQGCFLLTPRRETDSRFFYYWLATQTERLQILGRGSTFMELSTDELKSLNIPHPPLSLQRTIADYLDRETTRLDGLVAAKERVLGLLAEKRRALITRAVIRGLDPTVPLRDSGIPWLGEIPAHWQIAGFTKYLRSLVDYRGKTPEKTDSGVFLVTARNIRNGYIDYEVSQEYIGADAYEEAMQRGKPHLGDLLFTTEAPLGQVALVNREDIALAQRVIKLDYDPKVLSNEFMLQWMLSTPFQWQLNSFATGSTALGIKAERLHMLRNIIPSLPEQRAIVTHIEKETAKLDALREATERTIRLLKERRAALIAAAVTGQIEVEEPR